MSMARISFFSPISLPLKNWSIKEPHTTGPFTFPEIGAAFSCIASYSSPRYTNKWQRPVISAGSIPIWALRAFMETVDETKRQGQKG
jgi:hypothetical protein